MLGFKPAFSLFTFTLIKRLFSSSSLSAIRMVSSAYLRLLMLLLPIFIPACNSSSPAFLMMCSAYRLNNQGNNIQPWPTPFPIWNQCVFPCPVLTVASLPAYRFLKKQVRWSVLSKNIQGWFPLGLTSLILLLSSVLSGVYSSITVQKHQLFSAQSSLWSISHPHTWLL